MRTLRYEEQNGLVQATALVTLRSGKEFYVCDEFAHLAEMMEVGEPATGHRVVGMKPKPVILNPPHIATIEDARP